MAAQLAVASFEVLIFREQMYKQRQDRTAAPDVHAALRQRRLAASTCSFRKFAASTTILCRRPCICSIFSLQWRGVVNGRRLSGRTRSVVRGKLFPRMHRTAAQVDASGSSAWHPASGSDFYLRMRIKK